MTEKRADRRLKTTLLGGAAALAFLGTGAVAQETINNTRTTPVVTSTSGDVTIESAGSVEVADGTGVTIDSDNTVTNNGAVVVDTADGATGVLITGDATFTYTQGGDITLNDDRTNDTEVPLDYPDDRFGLRVAAGSYTGDITFNSGSQVLVDGDSSFGVAIEGDLDGNLLFAGEVLMNGEGSTAIWVDGDLSGDFTVEGNGVIAGNGKDSEAIRIGGDVGGGVVIRGRISANGYRDDSPDADDDEENNNDDQIALQSGNAVTITGNVANGILIDGALPLGFESENESDSTGQIQVLGGGRALEIDGGMAGTTIGLVDTSDVVEQDDGDDTTDPLGLVYGDFGLINRGATSTRGIYDGVATENTYIANATIAGGFRNDGFIDTTANAADATALTFGPNANVPMFYNAGRVSAGSNGTGGGSTAILLDATANVGSIVNDNRIESVTISDDTSAYGIRDLSGGVTSVENRGIITAVLRDDLDNRTEGTEENPDGDPIDPVGTGIAMDFSANTTGVTIYNTVRDDFVAGTGNRANFGIVTGDVLLGSGNDIYRADAGSTTGNLSTGSGNDLVELMMGAGLFGNINFADGDDALTLDDAAMAGNADFGAGTNMMSLTGGATFGGNLSNSGVLDIDISGSSLLLGNTTDTTITSLTATADGDQNSVLGFSVSADGTQVSRLTATSNISLAAGTEIRTAFGGAFDQLNVSEVILSSPDLDFDVDSLLLNADGQTPFLFEQSLSISETSSSDLILTLRRKTADEVGIGAALQPAYNPTITALTNDQALGSALFNATTQSEFIGAFNQIVAGPLDAPMAYARAQNNSVTSIITHRVDNLRRDEALPRTVWLQEETYFVNRDDDADSNGFDGGGFVIAMGADTPLGGLDVIGASLHLASARYDEQLGEDFPFNRLTYGADVYAGEALGPLEVDVRAGYAIAKSDSERNIVFGGERRQITGEWDGTQMTANGRVRYRTEAMGFEVVPFASVDFVALEEDAFAEEGDEVLALEVGDREAESLRANFGASIGKTFELRPSAYDTGIPGTLTPRFTAGYSHEMMDDPIDATYNFPGGDPFTLSSTPESNAAILAADLDYENQYAKIHAGVSGILGETTDILTLRVGIGLKW